MGKSAGKPGKSNERANAVPEAFTNSPKKSNRTASLGPNIPKSFVHDILHKELRFKCYKMQRVHTLSEEDYETRINIC